jgi:hypothetical protein
MEVLVLMMLNIFNRRALLKTKECVLVATKPLSPPFRQAADRLSQLPIARKQNRQLRTRLLDQVRGMQRKVFVPILWKMYRPSSPPVDRMLRQTMP